MGFYLFLEISICFVGRAKVATCKVISFQAVLSCRCLLVTVNKRVGATPGAQLSAFRRKLEHKRKWGQPNGRTISVENMRSIPIQLLGSAEVLTGLIWSGFLFFPFLLLSEAESHIAHSLALNSQSFCLSLLPYLISRGALKLKGLSASQCASTKDFLRPSIAVLSMASQT